MKIENIPHGVSAPIDWSTAICSESGDIRFRLAGHAATISISSLEILKLHTRMISAVAKRPDWSEREENGLDRLRTVDGPVSKLWLVQLGAPETASANAPEAAAVNGRARG